MCNFEADAPELYQQVLEYLPGIEGKPFLRICGLDRSCFVGNKMYDFRIVEAQLEGKTDWAVAIDDYPDEIWETFWISYDCLILRPQCLIDRYFRFYYVFVPELIERARNNDLSFLDEFLQANPI